MRVLVCQIFVETLIIHSSILMVTFWDALDSTNASDVWTRASLQVKCFNYFLTLPQREYQQVALKTTSIQWLLIKTSDQQFNADPIDTYSLRPKIQFSADCISYVPESMSNEEKLS
jgi:hypothetical protein